LFPLLLRPLFPTTWDVQHRAPAVGGSFDAVTVIASLVVSRWLVLLLFILPLHWDPLRFNHYTAPFMCGGGSQFVPV
jgi:hypothetical protein